MKLELITLTGPKVQEDVYEVMLPTATGDITVLPGHMPLITLAVPGVIAIRRAKQDSDDQRELYATNGGLIEVSQKVLRVLVDEADHADDIHEEHAQKALEHARRLKEQAKDQVELDHAQALIDRQAVRLKVADLRRHRRVRR
jgi:F-type H+-transporting ATPase subunit epsilon